MSDQVDTVGVVGTWLAVFLASLALVAIIGPLILLREAQSERTHALNTVDDPNQEFVSSGITLGLGDSTRLFQRIHVPPLHLPPKVDNAAVSYRLPPAGLKPSLESKTAWTEFIRTVQRHGEAYSLGINGSRNGKVVVSDCETLLKVHRLWILCVGLLGRYGHRVDRGRPKPWLNVERLDNPDLRDYPWNRPGCIVGSTGVLQVEPNSGTQKERSGRSKSQPTQIQINTSKVYFTRYDTDSSPFFTNETARLRLSLLFWLALGCLPESEQVIFDLAGFQMRRVARYSKNKRFYYRYQPITGLRTDSAYYQWASALGTDMHRLWILDRLRDETQIAEADNSLQRDSDGGSAGSSPWVLLNSLSSEYDYNKVTYLYRSDVHRLALVLLKLPMTTRHFLFNERRGRLGRFILCEASKELSTLVDAVNRSTLPLTLSDQQQEELQRLAKLLSGYSPDHRRNYSMRQNSAATFTRSLALAFFQLDDLLGTTIRSLKQTTKIGQQVSSILYLTNAYFRRTIKSLLKTKSATDICELEVDSSFTTVKLKASGKERKLQIDLGEVIGPDSAIKHPFKVDFTTVFLSALRSSLRSAWFGLSLDSRPLLDFARSLEDVVGISVNSAPESSAADLDSDSSDSFDEDGGSAPASIVPSWQTTSDEDSEGTSLGSSVLGSRPRRASSGTSSDTGTITDYGSRSSSPPNSAPKSNENIPKKMVTIESLYGQLPESNRLTPRMLQAIFRHAPITLVQKVLQEDGIEERITSNLLATVVANRGVEGQRIVEKMLEKKPDLEITHEVLQAAGKVYGKDGYIRMFFDRPNGPQVTEDMLISYLSGSRPQKKYPKKADPNVDPWGFLQN